MTTTNRTPEMISFRLAAASTLGSRVALDMLEACPVDGTDADGSYLVQVADPLPGDWEALESKMGGLGGCSAEERAAFAESYRETIEDAIEESGRE